MLPMLRTATVAGLLAMASAVQAATPISLPLGNLGGPLTADVELPVPPPPRVALPDVSRFRLVLKPTRDCDVDDRRATSRRQGTLSVEQERRAPGEQREAAPVRTSAPVRRPASSRLG